jgi:DNA polymerase-3 subunit gamma/tau
MARAVYSPATLVSAATGTVTLRLPNDTHRSKCEQHRSVVEEALAAHVGHAVAVELVVDDGGASGPSGRVAGGSSSQAPVVPTNEPPPTPAPRRDESAASMSEGALAHDIAPPAVPAPDSDTAHLSVVPTPDPEPVANGRAIAEQARTQGPVSDPEAGLQTLAESLPDDDEVDLDDLIDAPPDTVKTPVDRLAEAFPGSELVDDPS